ncbi:MAG: hypothetical protein ACI9T9_000745 [Oleiphilaceae bacterium]|jgi:uncharacterized protein YyaL (SSP411 family)
MNYTIISNDKILRTLNCSVDNLSAQISLGEIAIEGTFDNRTHKVIEGALIELSETELQNLSEQHKIVTHSNRQLILLIMEQLNLAGQSINVDIIKTKDGAKKAIDLAAGRARARVVSPGVLTTEEYYQAKEQALYFIANPAQTVPSMIKTWSEASARTYLEAAEHILQNASDYEIILNATYDLRLKGKAAVNAASEDFAVVAKTYIDYLDAL